MAALRESTRIGVPAVTVTALRNVETPSTCPERDGDVSRVYSPQGNPHMRVPYDNNAFSNLRGTQDHPGTVFGLNLDKSLSSVPCSPSGQRRTVTRRRTGATVVLAVHDCSRR